MTYFAHGRRVDGHSELANRVRGPRCAGAALYLPPRVFANTQASRVVATQTRAASAALDCFAPPLGLTRQTGDAYGAPGITLLRPSICSILQIIIACIYLQAHL